jgi:hypothetical protein
MTSPLSSPRRPGALAAALLAGPVFTLAGMALTPWESDPGAAGYLRALADHPTQAQAAALLLVVGYALLGLAMVTVLRLVRAGGGVSRGLFGVTSVLVFFAATVLPGTVVIDWAHLAMVQGLPLDDAVRVFEASTQFGLLQLVRIPAVAGMVLGGLLTVVCAWRAGLVGVWAPVVTVAGFGLVVLGPAGIVGGSAVTVLIYGAIAVRATRAPSLARPAMVPAAA